MGYCITKNVQYLWYHTAPVHTSMNLPSRFAFDTVNLFNLPHEHIFIKLWLHPTLILSVYNIFQVISL